MTKQEIEKDLETLYNTYCEGIENLCRRIEKENIKPLVKRKKWKFFAGMGTWVFQDRNGKSIHEKDLPDKPQQDCKELHEILSLCVEGFSQDLGSLCNDC